MERQPVAIAWQIIIELIILASDYSPSTNIVEFFVIITSLEETGGCKIDNTHVQKVD